MLEPKDLHVGDVIGKDGPQGALYVVIAAFPEKVVVQRTIDLTDLADWSKINTYTTRPEP
jgi:hypothetical protein